MVVGRLAVPPRRVAAVVAAPAAPAAGVAVRVYDRTRNVVVVPDEQGQRMELPYIAAPVLFVEGTAELLDATANADLHAIAAAILEIHATEPGARFVIEGHTSTDGGAAENSLLSVHRAQRIHALLTTQFGVPAAILSAQGYGEDYAEFPDGTEEQLQQDRRVLVVRTQ